MNVINTIDINRTQSEIICELEVNQEIKIVGAIYDMDSGKVI